MSFTSNTIVIYRGNNRTLQLEILEPDATPFVLTGCTVKLYVKKKPEDANADAVIELSGTITDAVNGLVEFYLLPSHTINAVMLQEKKPYPYDVEITTLTPKYYTCLRSQFIILQS